MSSIIESLWENFSYLPLKECMRNQSISLKQWPNFGFSDYKPEFVTIAAILSKRNLSGEQIIKTTGFEPHVVHSFLNASYLLKLIDIQPVPNQVQASISEKFNAFTIRMRHVFGLKA